MADESDAGHASAMYVYCVVLCAIWGWGGWGRGGGGGVAALINVEYSRACKLWWLYHTNIAT